MTRSLLVLASLALPATARLGAQASVGSEPSALRVDSAAVPRDARIVRVGSRELIYTSPRRFEMVSNLPSDFARATRSALRGDRLWQWAALGAGTIALIAVDQPLVDEMQRFGERIHLSKDHSMVTIAKVPIPFAKKSFPIRGPKTFSSFLYFLGDGWSSVLTAGGLATAGAFTGDQRALRTASEVMESFLATGITAQILKHSFGRETPSESERVGSREGGRWRFFPSWSEYSGNVPGYDAFPSGHLATVMSTVSVVALNYPEKRWIRPVSYSIMTVLAFQMMNNGVHWASDYPIAIAVGDLFAHIVVARGRTERRLGPSAERDEVPRPGLQLTLPELRPHIGLGGPGLALVYRF